MLKFIKNYGVYTVYGISQPPHTNQSVSVEMGV